MNPDVRDMRNRIDKTRVKTRIRCLDCDGVVMTNDIKQMRTCGCGNITVWQHPDGVEILHKDNNYQVLEAIY